MLGKKYDVVSGWNKKEGCITMRHKDVYVINFDKLAHDRGI